MKSSTMQVQLGCLQVRAAHQGKGHAVATSHLHRKPALPTCHPLQIVGILRGRPSADAPGGGHCATVLAVDAAQQVGCMLIATGGHAGDGTLKIWRHVQMPAAEAGAAGAAANGAAAAEGAAAAADGAAPMDAS